MKVSVKMSQNTETVTTLSKIDLEIFQTHLNPSTQSQLSSVSIRFAIQPLQLFFLRNVKMMRENGYMLFGKILPEKVFKVELGGWKFQGM